MATHQGIRIHQYLDDWFGESHIPPGLSPAYSRSSGDLSKLGWLVNLEKSELEPKQIFDFVGYQFDLKAGWV